jgi:hypothetical protein
VVSEINDSPISMNKTPIKESILNFSQSAHARVDRNRKIIDFTYLTNSCGLNWRSPARVNTGQAQNQAGGTVISANAEGLRARRRSKSSGRRLEEIFPKQVRLTAES